MNIPALATFDPLEERAKLVARKCRNVFLNTAMHEIGWDGHDHSRSDFLKVFENITLVLDVAEQGACYCILAVLRYQLNIVSRTKFNPKSDE